MRSSLRERVRRGQSMVEYTIVMAGFLGFTLLGWPFLPQLLNALDRYFRSLYYIIQSPVP